MTSEDQATAVIKEMIGLASPEKAANMQRFFKTGVGQYAEGDSFLGIPNPSIRRVVKSFAALPLPEIETLLIHPYHEIRCCALLIMVTQYDKSDRAYRDRLLALYTTAAPTQINNWDLVDLSAPGIVGRHEQQYHSDTINRFAAGRTLWEQRIAVVSTLTLIRHGEFDAPLRLCTKFLTHQHDLMHKACGWMLREIGKRDRDVLTGFLNQHGELMPRTMLRYAIEHYPEAQRKTFLAKGKKTSSIEVYHG